MLIIFDKNLFNIYRVERDFENLSIIQKSYWYGIMV